MQDMFLHLHEVDDLRLELSKTKEQIDNLRRGIFGRFDILVSKLSDLEQDMSIVMQELELKENNCEQLQFDFAIQG